MKKILFFVIVIIIVSITAAMAQNVPPPPPPAPAATTASSRSPFPAPCLMSSLHIICKTGIDMLSSKLKLTDDQKTKVDDLMSKADTAIKPKIDHQKKAIEAYSELLAKSDTSDAVLLAAADEVMKAEAAIVAEKIKTLQALRALLDDQQKNELNSILLRYTAPKPMSSMQKN